MSREAFEAWYEQYRQTVCMLYGAIDCLDSEDVAFAGWKAAWQAAQADAYERAAKVCRDQWYAADCVEAIHELAKEVEK